MVKFIAWYIYIKLSLWKSTKLTKTKSGKHQKFVPLDESQKVKGEDQAILNVLLHLKYETLS